jgi:hypothetical protein
VKCRFPSPQQNQIIAAFGAKLGSDASATLPDPDTAEPSKLVLQPSLLDGLSFPVCLPRLNDPWLVHSPLCLDHERG